MRRLFTIFMLTVALGHCSEVLAQERTVSGKVTSADDSSPLPGVNILIQGTTQGTVADVDGNYTLRIPGDNTVLVFSSIGFTTQTIPVGNRSVIDVALESDIRQLDEVVVTSFGIEQDKKSLGYAVQEVNSQEILETKQQNVVSALQGQVAGVQITNSGGAPGQSARIVIRGINSLNPNADNQPLFVIDGVPIDNSTTESSGTPRGLSNRAADINPNDIESMNVLKGAAATALYGVRAANGAVIITTKKGRAGEIRVNLNSSVGLERVNRFPDFQEEYGQGFGGDYDPDSFWPSWGAPIDEVAKIVPGHKYEDNWRDAMQTGVQVDNAVSISGGNENATFYGSFGRLDHKGIIPFSEWDRTSAKLSGKVNVSEKFEFSGSINYIKSGGNRVPHDRFMERMVYWAETQDINNYINPDGTMVSVGTNTNAIYDARFSTYEDDVNRSIGNLTFTYKPVNWLHVTYRIGTDFYSDSRTEITPGPMGIEGEAVLSSTGFIEETRINSRDINSNLFITLNKQFSEKFAATLRLGNDIFDRRRETVTARGDDFVIPQFYDLSYTAQISNSQDLSTRRLVGAYGDLMLDYNNLLFLNITGRNDWTSTLPEENRSFFYPSVNLGFVFSEAFETPDFLSFGKLRASWARVGKDTDPHLIGVTYVASDIYPLNGQVGFSRNSSFGDLDLKPEETVSIEFGANLAFLQNRLGLDITWYKSNSRDQIIPVPVSDATGFSEFTTNAGEIENRGFEFIINATPVETSNFTWDIAVNAARNKNEIVDIREGIEEIVIGEQFGYASSTVTMKLIEGEAYGNLYGRSYERYYANGVPENLMFLDRDLPLVIGPDGFPVTNTNQLILGNATPDWIGGIKNSFSYKGFDFSFLVDFRSGIEQYNQYGNFLAAFGTTAYTANRNDVVIFNGVLADGSPNTKQVWLGQGVGPDGVDYGAGFYRNSYRGSSENFVKDASYVKLRNISLGYNFQQALLDATPFRSARISVAVNNIILYTPWDGFDPESFSAGAGGNATGFTGLGYPGTESYFLTLNLGF